MIGPSQIRRQILTVALVPALLIALVMMAFYLHTRLESLDESMHQRIHATAEGLASTSEFALFSGDVSYLRNLGVIESLESNSDFQVGMLRDNDGQVLIEWGAQEAWQIPLDRLPTVEGQLPVDDDLHLVFHHPVSVSPAAIDTPLSLENAPARATDERRQLGWVTLQFSREALVAERDAIIFKSMLITLGGLLLGGLLAFRMSTTLSERIHHLAETVRQIGRGRLDTRATVESHGELGVLEQGINHMAAALAQSRERMQQEIDSATGQLRETLRTVAAQESRYRELVQNANSAVIKLDLEGRITFFNEFAEHLFGYTEAEILGQPAIGTLLDRRYADRFAKVLEEPQATPLESTRHVSREGRVAYVDWSARLLHDANDQRVGLIAIGNDVTENRRISRAIGLLARAGTHDSPVYRDIARALQNGLACGRVGIVTTDYETGSAHLLALVDDNGVPVEDASPDLPPKLSEACADGTGLAIAFDPIREHPALATLSESFTSLYAEPVVDREHRVIGCLFAAENSAWRPSDAGRNLLRLMARRLGLELQRQSDENLLRQTRDEALTATEAKSRFLANVSHEIRTPMNGIIGFSKLLMREPLNSRQHDQVGMIQHSAQSLLAIINDILDLAKIEAGRLEVAHTEFDLVDTIEELIATFAVQAHQKGLELCHRLDGTIPLQVVGDAQRLIQILTNLLGNAIKFTERGVVSLDVGHGEALAGPSLRFEITDTGIGINEKELGQLFDQFSQLDSTSARRHEGTGLGLAISRQLCELLDGRIGVTSHPGQGSCFSVELPLKAAAEGNVTERFNGLLGDRQVAYFEPEPRVAEMGAVLLGLAGARVTHLTSVDALGTIREETADLVIVSQSVSEDPERLCGTHLPLLREHFPGPVLVLTCDSINPVDTNRCMGCSEWCKPKPLLLRTLEQELSHRSIEQADGRHQDGWLEGHRVLVCDDNAVNRALAVTLLEDYGAEVVEARDGREAIASVSPGIGLVLMDLHMPGMSGTEAAQRIREKLGDACPPIIAVTASAMEGERERSLTAGLDDHLTKPLDETLLVEVLHRWLHAPEGHTPHKDSMHRSADEVVAAVEVLDLHSARAITGGRTELLHKMLRMFLDEVPQHRAELEQGWRGNDTHRLRAALHKLRGSAEYCALARLARAIGDAEEVLVQEGMQASERQLEDVHIELERAAAEARRHVEAQE